MMVVASSGASCGCPPAAFPAAIANPPGQATIADRIGDFTALRAALLRPLPGETALAAWTPRAQGDLALQLVDWWAYIGDILCFYGDRIANESYLRTAQLPESVAHLTQVLGYRPRPALGSKGVLAALLASGARAPVAVAAGTQIQSKPGPGAAPQVFEVSADTTVAAPDVVIARVVPARAPLLGADGATLWLAGKISGVKPGDRLLLAPTTALSGGAATPQAWITVADLTAQKDPLGRDVTALGFAIVAGELSGDLRAGDFALLRPRQSAPLWTLDSASPAAITNGSVELAGLARGLGAGALMLIDVAPQVAPVDAPIWIFDWSLPEGTAIPADFRVERFDPAAPTSDIFGTSAVIVTAYSEAPRYVANPPANTTPLGILQASITFASLSPTTAPEPQSVTIRWDWASLGTPVPVLTAADYTTAGAADPPQITLDPTSKNPFPASAVPVVIADANGVSDKATLAPAGDGTATLTGLTQDLAAPLSLYFDPLPVTRGKTVANEVLGSGDTRIAGQDFTLAKAPVTYFTDPASVSGDQFSSTVKVSVNGIAWQEARSFFGAGPTDTIFVLREDDSGKTHVQFGDGVNGARLPTGTDNVVATYRYGAGLAAPAADTLVTVLTPVPGLKGVANPVAPTGGSDADPPARIRQLAPASVLTLGRVVSLDDFAAVALATGGVSLASAQFAIDPDTQRPRTVVHVAGDGGVIAAVTAALQAAGANPSLFRVVRAQAILARLSVGYLRDPRYADADVAARLQTALTDADTGLLGANVLQIGQAIYDSRIAVTCAAVTGVRSISAIEFATVADRFVPEIVRFPGGWRPGFVSAPPVMRHDPGAGCYFSVPADRVVLTGQAGGPD
jgi:hypothetical protein